MFEMHVSDGLNQYEEDREGNSMEVYSKEFTSMLFFLCLILGLTLEKLKTLRYFSAPAITRLFLGFSLYYE